MCFSATASFTSGVILTVAGIFSIRQVKSKNSIPFAIIPLLFGIQQIIEGMVWVSFGLPALHSVVVNIFVFIAYVFWPTYVPIAIGLLEKDPKRKKLLWIISLIGALVGIYLFIMILLVPVTASIINKSICYNVNVFYPFPSFLLYLIAVCGGSIISSSRKIHVFGTAMLLGFFMAYAFYPQTFFSVWCFFSAGLSIIIYVHMKDLRKLYEEALAKIG